MMVPQPTAQYGHVERVSLARAILSTRSWAKAGRKSKPKTAAAVPPMVVSFRKSRRDGFTEIRLSARNKKRKPSRPAIHKTLAFNCQGAIGIFNVPLTLGVDCCGSRHDSCALFLGAYRNRGKSKAAQEF